jgi:thioesterase domain-containing protein
VAQKTGINFVVHLKEMLAGLLVGVPQWIAPDAVVRDTPVFARAIAKHGITRLNLVPSHLDGLLEHAENLRGLRYVVTAGEALPEALRARFARLLPSTELFNNYGSTEMNDITYFHAAGPSAPSQHESIGDTVPIGKPIQNLRLHIFDDDGHPLPFGVAGELYVEGAAVGPKGYWGRPELTGERWVRNRAGALLFRTGDVVRLDRQSSRSQDHALDLRYMGRSDFQVKLRGQKVDPLQVEQALRTHPQLEEAAVQGWYSGQPQALLAAYYTVRSENVAPDRNELHRWLAGRLPFYMVPSAFIRLQAMPRLENGKLDRRGLPEPELETKTAGAHCPPETLQEQEMAAAWAEVLQIPLDSIGRDDNFFAIGGNSLLAVQLVERLKPAMPGIDVQLVFETPVLRKLSARTHEAPKEAVERHSFAHVLPLRASGTGTPLFCIHPIFGFGWAYAGMLSTLESSRPVYVIQAMGLSPEEELPRSFEEMIGDYIRKIRCLQPHGPYQLCGWSFGGIVAQAIAAQLQAEQEEVQFLCILDASPFGEGHRSSFDPNLNLRRVLEIFAAQSLSSFGLDSSAINAEMIDRVVRIVFNSADNLSKYKLKTYQGDALFVRATLKSSEVFGQFFSTHAAEQWSRYIAGKVECVDVESTHLALLEGANGIAVGKLIENRLVALEAAAKA